VKRKPEDFYCGEECNLLKLSMRFRRHLAAAIIAFHAIPHTAIAGENPVYTLAKDFGAAASAPARFDGGDWAVFGAVAGTAGLAMLADKSVNDSFIRSRTNTTDAFGKVGNAFGNGKILLPALGAAYLAGKATGSERLARTAALSVDSLLVSGAIACLFKAVARRHRPSQDDNPFVWHGPDFNADASFPSGHTTIAFAVAGVWAEEYGDVPGVAPLAYGLAAMTAVSRLNSRAHWLSDVVAGGALGYFTAKGITARHRKPGNTALLPLIGPGRQGVIITKRF